MPQLSASAPISNRHLDLLITNHFSALTSHPPRDGGGGIRTHEGLRPAGFQDRSHQPLDHPSKHENCATTNFLSKARSASCAGVQRLRQSSPKGEKPADSRAGRKNVSTRPHVHMNIPP